MTLSATDQSLLLAAYFRGNTLDQNHWTSSADQVLTLSLFYTGDITADECQARFAKRSYVVGLRNDDGTLHSLIVARYKSLTALFRSQPHLIEGAGDFDRPADPKFTACRLTNEGIRYIPQIIDQFPCKPDFPNWPDRRAFPSASGFKS